MADLSEIAAERAAEFDARAWAYDKFRPRYPTATFDAIISSVSHGPVRTAIDVGCGTGIGALPLLDRGIDLLGIEPAPQMAAIAEIKFAGRARCAVTRFEEWESKEPVDLICSFNSWHWVNSASGLDKAAETLRPGGCLALVWNDVVQYGESPFDRRLEDVLGEPIPEVFGQVTACVRSVSEDPRFTQKETYRHEFSRDLDAETFVNVRNTYVRQPDPVVDEAISSLIRREFDGRVTKTEAAVAFIFEV